MNILKQALGGISGGKVLDVASGEGDFVKTLVKNLRSYEEIIGIDILGYTESAESIFNTEDVRFMQMDAGRLDFVDERFDTVSISNALHHLKDVPRCIGEMKRVLRSGGHLIIRETHRNIQIEPQLTDMYIHHWVAEIDTALGHIHTRTFTRRELIDLAEGLGLAEVAFYDIPNTDSDPMNKAAIKESEEVIERYMRHAEGLSGQGALVKRGQELRRRLHRVGIQWEPELIIVGRKR
ncbi:MAG: class I SAM-dependent methyltransferase [bacterium]|jgi:SAM-dependent methyltransferase